MEGLNVNPMEMQKERMSGLVSFGGWFFVGAATFSLFFAGLFVLWPISFVFDKASGYLPHRLSQFWASLIARKFIGYLDSSC